MEYYDQETFVEEDLSIFLQRLVWDYPGCSHAEICLLRTIRKHLFDESLNVNWLLDHCGNPDAAIHARFRHHMKMSIREFVENRRILAAMWLLWLDGLPAATISFSVGYRNYRSFARAFKRHVGCAPLAYRSRMSLQNVYTKCPVLVSC